MMNLGSQRCCVNHLVTGPIGTQGAQGPYGPIGTIGVTGSTGNTGATGDPGLCYRGRQGPQGAVGPQGGLTGDTGIPGPQGAPGTTSLAINSNFSFITTPDASYGTGYTDLIGLSSTLSSTLINNSVTFSLGGTYAINWEISEDWADSENKFYVRLNNIGIEYLEPTIFNAISPCVLYSSNKIFVTGNDIITIGAGTYSIELMQSNTSGTITIGGKLIKFSITFIQIS
jgi:hypothetical protein